MLIPIFSSYQLTELDFKESTRFSPDAVSDLITCTAIVKLKPHLLTVKGSKLRLILKGNQVSNTSITGCYVGKSSVTGKSYDFATTPTAITYNGSLNFTIPSQGLATDIVDFDTNDIVPYTFAFGVVSSRYARYDNAIQSYPSGSRPVGYQGGDLVNWVSQGAVVEPAVVNKVATYSGTQDRDYIIGSILIA
jgi:hypothetical protein